VRCYSFAYGTPTRRNEPREREHGEEVLVKAVSQGKLGEAVFASGDAQLMAEFARDVLKHRWPQAEPAIMADERAKSTYMSMLPDEADGLVPFYTKAPPGNPPAMLPEPVRDDGYRRYSPDEEEPQGELALKEKKPKSKPKPGGYNPSTRSLIEEHQQELERGELTQQEYDTKVRMLTRRPWKLQPRQFLDPGVAVPEKATDEEVRRVVQEDPRGPGEEWNGGGVLAPWVKNISPRERGDFTASLRERWLARRAGIPVSPNVVYLGNEGEFPHELTDAQKEKLMTLAERWGRNPDSEWYNAVLGVYFVTFNKMFACTSCSGTGMKAGAEDWRNKDLWCPDCNGNGNGKIPSKEPYITIGIDPDGASRS
jgi:hypothetical protein